MEKKYEKWRRRYDSASKRSSSVLSFSDADIALALSALSFPKIGGGYILLRSTQYNQTSVATRT